LRRGGTVASGANEKKREDGLKIPFEKTAKSARSVVPQTLGQTK
jgi:hypothetical protein